MMRRPLIAFVAALFLGCQSSAAPRTEDEAVLVSSGLSTAPYDGAFLDYRAVSSASTGLLETAAEAERLLLRRIGLSLDSERPRVIFLADDLERIDIQTRVIAGRMVQEIAIPAAPLAQGRARIAPLVTEALCRAALTDLPKDALPAWFVRGAPLWVSGAWEDLLHRRILGGPRVDLLPDRLVPPLDPASPNPDLLSAGFFLRFLAEEFGAERIPDVQRALQATEDEREALLAALGTDPAALPVAFDGFRERELSGLSKDPFLRELSLARDLSPRLRVQRLSGLSARAPDPYVAAAMLEEIGLAQFESGDLASAAQTFARIERDHARHALHLDRDRFYFALTFARRGEDAAAALRLSTFLSEFPDSDFASLGLFELGSILVAQGRMEDAVLNFRTLLSRHPRSPSAQKALLVLAACERARGNLARARGLLSRALPDPVASRQLADLDREIRAPGPALRNRVKSALRDLASPVEEEGKRGVEMLIAIGPAAAGILRSELMDGTGRPRNAPRDLLIRLARVQATWPREKSVPALAHLLCHEDVAVSGAGLEALVELGLSRQEIDTLIRRYPHSSGSARRAFHERFGGDEELTDVRGLLQSGDHMNRIEAARRLASRKGPDALDLLEKLAGDDSPQVRRAAIAALGHRAEPAGLSLLSEALSDPSSVVRLEAVRALGRRHHVDPVRRSLADTDGRVRIESAQVLLDRPRPGDADRVVVLLSDPDGGVRSMVEGILGRAKAPGLDAALTRTLRSATEPGLDIRLVRVIARRSGSDFGYDPRGGNRERRRVAYAFEAWVEKAASGRD